MALTIRTDNKWKQLKYRYEVPKAVLSTQFDYLDEDDGNDGFILYKGHWYHTSDFMRLPSGGDFKGWDGAASDSYFSGVIVKLAKNGEEYIIGNYSS